MSKDLPDLSRTATALRAYDLAYIRNDFEKVDKLAKAVAMAYWEDTKDRNNKETILATIKPGNPRPLHPDNLSFVRKMVRDWIQQQREQADVVISSDS